VQYSAAMIGLESNDCSGDYWRIINQVSLCVQQAVKGPIKTFVHCYFVFTITKEIHYMYNVYTNWEV